MNSKYEQQAAFKPEFSIGTHRLIYLITLVVLLLVETLQFVIFDCNYLFGESVFTAVIMCASIPSFYYSITLPKNIIVRVFMLLFSTALLILGIGSWMYCHMCPCVDQVVL